MIGKRVEGKERRKRGKRWKLIENRREARQESQRIEHAGVEQAAHAVPQLSLAVEAFVSASFFVACLCRSSTHVCLRIIDPYPSSLCSAISPTERRYEAIGHDEAGKKDGENGEVERGGGIREPDAR